jgi:hypothetical protein
MLTTLIFVGGFYLLFLLDAGDCRRGLSIIEEHPTPVVRETHKKRHLQMHVGMIKLFFKNKTVSHFLQCKLNQEASFFSHFS